jgi:hypothetical protein
MQKPSKKLQITWAALVLITPVLVWASNLTVPNTFMSGQPIKSADMNANFTAVQLAVNSKQDAITTTCPAGQAVSGVAAVGGALTCVPAGFAFGDSVSGNSPDSGVTVVNAGLGAAIEGDNSAPYVFGNPPTVGVIGKITDPTAHGYGVFGECNGGQGAGVYGTGGQYGVQGYSSSGYGVFGGTNTAGVAGVVATNSNQQGMALDIGQGYFQVQGAGANTNTTAFIWTATSANSGADTTTIYNPMTNGNPNLILIVTQNWSPNAVYNPHPVGVYYTGSNWAIFNEDQAAMTLNASFNVLVISP